jgi:hypothetical protein
LSHWPRAKVAQAQSRRSAPSRKAFPSSLGESKAPLAATCNAKKKEPTRDGSLRTPPKPPNEQLFRRNFKSSAGAGNLAAQRLVFVPRLLRRRVPPARRVLRLRPLTLARFALLLVRPVRPRAVRLLRLALLLRRPPAARFERRAPRPERLLDPRLLLLLRLELAVREPLRPRPLELRGDFGTAPMSKIISASENSLMPGCPSTTLDAFTDRAISISCVFCRSPEPRSHSARAYPNVTSSKSRARSVNATTAITTRPVAPARRRAPPGSRSPRS